MQRGPLTVEFFFFFFLATTLRVKITAPRLIQSSAMFRVSRPLREPRKKCFKKQCRKIQLLTLEKRLPTLPSGFHSSARAVCFLGSSWLICAEPLMNQRLSRTPRQFDLGCDPVPTTYETHARTLTPDYTPPCVYDRTSIKRHPSRFFRKMQSHRSIVTFGSAHRPG